MAHHHSNYLAYHVRFPVGAFIFLWLIEGEILVGPHPNLSFLVNCNHLVGDWERGFGVTQQLREPAEGWLKNAECLDLRQRRTDLIDPSCHLFSSDQEFPLCFINEKVLEDYNQGMRVAG